MDVSTINTEVYNQALDIFEERKDMLVGAAFLVFFQRYTHGPTTNEPIWRIHAVTKVGIRGDFAAHPVRQLPRSIALEVLRITQNARTANVITRWGDMSPLLQRRIVGSTILPMEFKTIQRMNRLDVETDGDFLVSLGCRPVMEMLS